MIAFGFDDLKKILVGLFIYLVIGPIVGAVCAYGGRWSQRLLIFLMILVPSALMDTTSIMAVSIEEYRGHTKGFLISLMDVLAIASIVASMLAPGKNDFRFFPIGTIPYLLFCSLASISILAATEPLLSAMASWKFFKLTLYLVAGYNFIRNKGDMRTVFWAIAISIIVQFFAVLKVRYVDGVHQSPGLFDHQNSMSMWAYFVGLPMLAVGLSEKANWLESFTFLGAFGMVVVMVVCSLSRAALAVTLGTGGIILFLFLIRRITWKRSMIVLVGALGSVAILVVAADTIVSRFSEKLGNDDSLGLRQVLNEMSAKMLDDSAIGVGWNNFNVVNSRPNPRYSPVLENWHQSMGKFWPERLYENNPNTECLYWMYLAETGYPGFFGLIILMLYLLYLTWRNFLWLRKDDTLESAFLLGLGVTLVVFYMHSYLERILTQTPNLSVYLLFFGVVSRFESVRRGQEGSKFLDFLARFFNAMNSASSRVRGAKEQLPSQRSTGSGTP